MHYSWIKIYFTCLLISGTNSVYDYYEGDFDEEQDYNDIDTTTKSSTLSNKKESEGNLIHSLMSFLVFFIELYLTLHYILHYYIKVKLTLIRLLTKFWSS